MKKTIIETSSKVSKYLLEDDAIISITESDITIPNCIIWDMNSNNAELVENVEAPEDWVWCKYIYDSEAFTLNPDYVEPEDV